MPAAAIPAVDDMFSVWRADRCVQDASAHNYIRWIKWFRFYVNCLGLEERAELTQEGARRFAEWYGRHRGVDQKKMARAQTALHALSHVYEVMGSTHRSGPLPDRRFIPLQSCYRSMPTILPVIGAARR
jgi:hypothetical protein